MRVRLRVVWANGRQDREPLPLMPGDGAFVRDVARDRAFDDLRMVTLLPDANVAMAARNVPRRVGERACVRLHGS